MLSYSVKEQTSLTVALPGGGTLTLRPVTTPSFEAAKATARKQKAALLAEPDALRALGIDPEIDIDNEAAMEGLFLGFLIAELGVRLITGWTGVADDSGDKEADVTPDNIRRLLKHPGAASALYTAVLADLLPGIVIKKDSGTAAPGITAAVPPIATDAAPKA
jgi:hypothetical protein